jgi:hypothetical protein
MSDPALPLAGAPPRWVICEDGVEYLERFRRFLDGEFEFVASGDARAAALALSTGSAGIILDLDFRRTAPALLVDETGASGESLGSEERRRLAETQGILVLRRLRAEGHRAPALLFADLDDEDQAAWLERTLAPLEIVPSHESLQATAARMRRYSPRR